MTLNKVGKTGVLSLVITFEGKTDSCTFSLLESSFTSNFIGKACL